MPSCSTATSASTLSSTADSSPNDNMSRRQQRSAFVSPGSSPTRYGISQQFPGNATQRMLASGRFSPLDGSSLPPVPIDATEAARKSRTLPLPTNKLLAGESSVVQRGIDDVMATSGVIPKALSRDELTGTDLDIGSVVEFDIKSERHYGVIRWIGYLPNNKKRVIIGIELVSDRS